MFLRDLIQLTKHHKEKCSLYRNYLNSFYEENIDKYEGINEIPFLPVRAFKEFDLKSIKEKDLYKTMTSSGTSGAYSKIYLDKETANLQSAKLIEIFKDTFGSSRFPMLIIDTESTIKNRTKFSARTAAINGFSIFGRRRCFALDDNLELNLDAISSFIEENANQTFFIFGFTFMIWEYFIKKLQKLNKKIYLPDSFILHGGGWKKLENQKVSNELFKEEIKRSIGCKNVRNYYGMVEQTGTIFMECSEGNLHAPVGADVIIRSKNDLSYIGHDKEGVIQVFSVLQKSYPGHSILTEDVGISKKGSSCQCGNRNTIIKVTGRLQNAEIRGCSDAYS